MDSFLGAGKKLGQEVKKALKDGASLAQRKARASINWPRDSLSTNTEQELQDLGNVEEGNQIVIQGQAEESPVASGVVVPIGEDLRNLEEGNQTVIQGFGNQNDIEEENQDDIQGGDPHGRRYDVVEVYMQLVYGRLKIYKILMAFNMAFSVLLISDIAPLKGDLFRGASVVISVVHAFVVVLINRCDAFLWIDILLLTGEVLVTTANFL